MLSYEMQITGQTCRQYQIVATIFTLLTLATRLWPTRSIRTYLTKGGLLPCQAVVIRTEFQCCSREYSEFPKRGTAGGREVLFRDHLQILYAVAGREDSKIVASRNAAAESTLKDC